jgi:hypothetical protein
MAGRTNVVGYDVTLNGFKCPIGDTVGQWFIDRRNETAGNIGFSNPRILGQVDIGRFYDCDACPHQLGCLAETIEVRVNKRTNRETN